MHIRLSPTHPVRKIFRSCCQKVEVRRIHHSLLESQCWNRIALPKLIMVISLRSNFDVTCLIARHHHHHHHLCYAMIYYVMLCCVMSFCDIVSHVVLYVLCYVMLRWFTLCCVMLYYGMLCYAMANYWNANLQDWEMRQWIFEFFRVSCLTYKYVEINSKKIGSVILLSWQMLRPVYEYGKAFY